MEAFNKSERAQQIFPHHPFKTEGIPTLRDLISQGDCMIKLDLKDAYFMVPITPFF